MREVARRTKKPVLFFNEEQLRQKPVLYASEIQKLLGLVYFPQHYATLPNWCVIRKPKLIPAVLLLFVDRLTGIVCDDSSFYGMFGKPLSFYSPVAYNYSWEEEILYVPRQCLSKHAMHMVDTHKSVQSPAPKRIWTPLDQAEALAKLRQLTHISEQICSSTSTAPDNERHPVRHTGKQCKRNRDHHCPFPMPAPGAPDAFDRTQLLMNLEQMLHEHIPIPPELEEQFKRSETDVGYIPSKPFYRPVSPSSPMFAIDCEMVVTKMGSELARVTMVDELNCVVFDRLVKPEHPVEDYVTKFSGITRAMLAPITTQVTDIQREVNDLLPPDAILVGHSIGNDLHAMKIYHPYLIDTSVIYNLKGARSSKARLRFLSEHFLGRMIQTGKAGHSSAEDAIATMDLVRLKLSQDLSFGDVTTMWRFPENYNAATANKCPKLSLGNTVANATEKSAHREQSSSPTEPKAGNVPQLRSDMPVHSAFKLKVAALQTSYNTFGPPVHFVNRLLRDCGVSSTCWPVYEEQQQVYETETVTAAAATQQPGTPTESAVNANVRNILSKKVITWLANMARMRHFVMCNVRCSTGWDDTKCNTKVAKLSRKLFHSLPEHSLLILICTGASLLDGSVEHQSADLGANVAHSAKRQVYITLTKKPENGENHGD